MPFKDLVSMFLFEDKNDLNIFVKRVREELKLAVHTGKQNSYYNLSI